MNDRRSSLPVQIAGPAGALEGRLEEPTGAVIGCAVVGHPHPRHGGTMTNNVVVHAARVLATRGLLVVRFNFRGVGGSAGSWGEGSGEREDYLAVLEWLRAQGAEPWPCLAAGFSFGAIKAFECAAAGAADRYLGIAPPFGLSEVGPLSPCPVPAGLVLAERDDLALPLSEEEVCQLLPELRAREIVAQADHLFTRRVAELREAVATCAEALL